MIHIADAPCHGTQYHSYRDNYPDGDPDISHESMMEEIVRLDIQYWFGYIRKEATNKMVKIFDEYLQNISQQHLIIRQFDAKDCDKLGEAVQRYVKDDFIFLLYSIKIVYVKLYITRYNHNRVLSWRETSSQVA